MAGQRIYTVSELNSRVRNLLEGRFPFLSVQGEISNLRRPYSGHLYFTLKDETSQLRAVLFKMQQRYLPRELQDGQTVICHGRLAVYQPRGEYQLIIDSVDFHGAGDLLAAVERLKHKLRAEGLFDPARKKKLPSLPGHIVLVTSPSGAAVRDFLRVAARRYPLARISVYPVTVQGSQAAAGICRALAIINEKIHADMIVLCRGGGSLEDLMVFNDEKLARAIAESELPVVSGIGHEIDTTICDLVSDLRASTPSGAAELVLPDRAALTRTIRELTRKARLQMMRVIETAEGRLALQRQRLTTLAAPLDQLALRLDHCLYRLSTAMQTLIRDRHQRLNGCARSLERHRPTVLIADRTNRLADLEQRLRGSMARTITNREAALEKQLAVLHAVGPKATLARGYAIVRKERGRGAVVTDSRDLKPGERARVILHRGELSVEVCDRVMPAKKNPE